MIATASTLQVLSTELIDIDEQIDALLENEVLNDEQKDEHDTLVSLREETVAKITKEEDRIGREKQRLELANRIDAYDEPQPRKTHAGAPAVHTSKVNPAKLHHRGTLEAFKGEVGGVPAVERAYRCGMWALATMGQHCPRTFNGKLVDNAQDFVRDEMALYSVDSSGTDIFIPTEFSSDMIDLRLKYGVVRNLFRIEPMGRDAKQVPRRTGGVTAYFEEEGGSATTSDPTHDFIELVAKKLRATTLMSREVDEDTIIDLGDRVVDEISYAFATKEDQCGLIGGGTSTHGRIKGINTRLQDVDDAGTDSFGLVTQGTGSTWAAIVDQDFHDTISLLPDYADDDMTAWVMHRTFYHSVVAPLILAAGGTTASEKVEFNGRTRPGYLGYPVLFSNVMPNATATTSVVATLGNFKKGACFGDRRQESIEFSDTATVGSVNCWEQEMIAIKGRQRFDINVHDVGSASEAGPIVGLQTGS